jgi:ATP-dependent helicase HrpB
MPETEDAMLDSLPIDAILPEVIAKLRAHSSVVLRAPTGAGKTTRVPPALLDAKLTYGRILVLEPRRLAARTAARRMAQEREQKLGDDIGYHVRFDRQVGSRTRIIVMTPGILLRMLQDDPYLESVGIVIFDEFHERSLDNDLALGMIRLVQSTVRPDLRIVAMSATLATDSIAVFLCNPHAPHDEFSPLPLYSGGEGPGVRGNVSPVLRNEQPRDAVSPGPSPPSTGERGETITRSPREDRSAACPIITSEGRLHPVEIAYEPRSLQTAWPVAAARAIERLLLRTLGDILCFLPGMQEIRQTARELQDTARTDNLLILSLHGDLSPEEQDRALMPQSQRRVVLATNVAETSVTVEGVTGVVDTGLARMQQFDASVGMDRLELTPIAKDAADQRAGRAGRTRPGVCVRLWSEASHVQRPAQTLPEIRRVDLAGAVLHLLSIGENDIRAFAWLEPPREDAIEQATLLLRRLGALDATGITNLGQAMARLPVHPRLARMLIEGHRLGATDRVALTAALLSERDPFLRAPDAQPTRRARSASDVLDRVSALEAFDKDGATTFPVGTLHAGAARFLLRARAQFVRTLQQENVPRGSQSLDSDEAVLRALLAAFPDRVAKRRDKDPTKGLMVGGVGVRFAPWCGIIDSPLFLCIDVNADPSETQVRLASTIERDWLPAESLTTRIEMFFDEASERVLARKRVYYEDLLLDENDAAVPRSDEVSRLLAEAARSRIARVLPADDSFLVRLRWLREAMPELNLPRFDDDELRELLPWVCAGCRSFDEVRRADWLGLLQGKLTSSQMQALEREAPERLQVPSGSRIALTYVLGRPPVLAVRIQEVFGWKDTPRVAGGRVRVLMHLLAPNHRPQQVTDDLASFWNNTYQQVRKELRIRYPKHAWPEDPWNAPAESKPKRRQ